MLLLKIHFGLSILTLCLIALYCTGLALSIKEEYGDVFVKKKVNKLSIAFELIKTIIKCCIPIFNIIVLLTLLFYSKEVEKIVRDPYEKLLADREKNK